MNSNRTEGARAMSELRIINFQEFEDMGSEAATVSVTDGHLYACHSSFRRGGCLYAGTVTVRNLDVEFGGSKEFEISSRASDTPGHLAYLIGLADKHVGHLTARRDAVREAFGSKAFDLETSV